MGLDTRELVYDLWFGGTLLTTGGCFSYDPNRRAPHDGTAAAAYYAQHPEMIPKVPGRNTYSAIPLVCMPKTTPISGIIPSDTQYTDLPEGNSTQISRWPVEWINEEDYRSLMQKMRTKWHAIRQEWYRDLKQILLLGGTSGATELEKKLESTFHELDVKARILKMLLTLITVPQEIEMDTSWPNIFDGPYILSELERYKGSSFLQLGDQFMRNEVSLQQMRHRLFSLESIGNTHQYPFIFFKEQFARWIETLQPHIVSNVLAKSSTGNIQEIRAFFESLPFFASNELQQLMQLIKYKCLPWVNKAALLRIQDAYAQLIAPPAEESKTVYVFGVEPQETLNDPCDAVEPGSDKEVLDCPSNAATRSDTSWFVFDFAIAFRFFMVDPPLLPAWNEGDLNNDLAQNYQQAPEDIRPFSRRGLTFFAPQADGYTARDQSAKTPAYSGPDAAHVTAFLCENMSSNLLLGVVIVHWLHQLFPTMIPDVNLNGSHRDVSFIPPIESIEEVGKVDPIIWTMG